MKRMLLILAVGLCCLSLAAEIVPLRQTEAMVYNRSVASLSDGSVITAWDEARTDDYDIFAQRFNALGQALWTSPKPLFRLSGTQRNVILVPTVDSCFVALCWDGTPGHYANKSFIVQKFNPEGTPLWGNASLEFPVGIATTQSYTVIANPIGGIYLVVFRGGSITSTIAYSYDSSGNQLWGEEGLLLSNQSDFYLDPMISDGSGGFIVNLKRYNPITNYLIHVSEQGMIIGNNPMLTESPFPGQHYSIKALTNGNILVYNYNSDSNREYIQIMNQSGNMLLTQPLWFYVDDGWAVPLLAATPDGGFYLCYPYDSNLHIVRVTAAGAIAWSYPGVTINGASSNNFNLCVDAAGNAIIVMQNFTTMTLTAYKISGSGTQLWTTNGITINNECREPEVPVLLSNANNTWFFWRDKIGTSQFIHQQVLNSVGTPLLPFGGTTVLEMMAGEVHLYTKHLAVNGYYYSFWHDSREGKYDIYMQKSDPNLNPVWEQNGKTFSGDEPGSKWMIDLLEGPNDQFAILYELYSPNSDTAFVYMQLLNSSGEALYPGHGIRINNGYSSYLSYDAGDYYVVWGTGGSTSGTVFGQRISNGQAAWGVAGKVLLQANYGFSIRDVISRFVILRLDQPVDGDTGHRLLKFDILGDPEPNWLPGGIQYFSDYDNGTESVVGTIIKNGYLYVILDGWNKDFMQKIGMDGSLPWGLEGVTLHSPPDSNHGCQNVVFGDAIYLLYMTNIDSNHTSVYLQKATWDGFLPWGQMGRPIISDQQNCISGKLMVFASGDITAVWTLDATSSMEDNIMQCVMDSQGNIQGSVQALCTAPYPQEYPEVAVIGNRGIVSWVDQRIGYSSDNYYEPRSLYATIMTAGQTDVYDPHAPEIARVPVLKQNYPNPFNPTTTISYDMPEPGIPLLSIYNIKGQLVRTLTQDQWQEAGQHRLVWDGTDMNGSYVGSGVYLYRLNLGSASAIKRMLLVK